MSTVSKSFDTALTISLSHHDKEHCKCKECKVYEDDPIPAGTQAAAERRDERIKAGIQKFGYVMESTGLIISLDEGSDEEYTTPIVYTIGLERWKVPNFVVIGLPPQMAGGIITDAVKQVYGIKVKDQPQNDAKMPPRLENGSFLAGVAKVKLLVHNIPAINYKLIGDPAAQLGSQEGLFQQLLWPSSPLQGNFYPSKDLPMEVQPVL